MSHFQAHTNRYLPKIQPYRVRLDRATWTLMIALLLFVITDVTNIFAQVTNARLLAHMIGPNVVLSGIGALIAGLSRTTIWLKVAYAASARYPTITAAICLIVVLIWHAPGLLEIALTDAAMHVMMHAASLVAGFGLTAALSACAPFKCALIVILMEGAMAVIGLSMIAGVVRYGGYLASEVTIAGAGMMVGMQAIWPATALVSRCTVTRDETGSSQL